LGAGEAPLPAVLEQLGHFGAVGAAQISEQLRGEVAVSFGNSISALGASS